MAGQPKKYSKPFLSYAKQISLLESRGLIIADKASAEIFLSHVNYYRFSGYCFSFESPRHSFIAGTTFEQVRQLYDLDNNLRALVGEILHFVEISARTTIAYELGSKYGALAHTDSSSFEPELDKAGKPVLDSMGRSRHDRWLEKFREETRRSSEIFVEHFKDTYELFSDGSAKLPIWSAVEIMSFGTVSQLFPMPKIGEQDAIAAKYGVHRRIFKSWLHTLVFARNVCAHHGRLWNRHVSIAPKLPKHDGRWSDAPAANGSRTGIILLILNQLARSAPHVNFEPTTWRKRVENVIQGDPGVKNFRRQMGLPENWPNHALWT